MNDKRLQEIESRVDKATPGERDFDECDGVWHVTIGDGVEMDAAIIADCMTLSDAKFFAHAPADMRWLIEQLKAAQKSAKDSIADWAEDDTRMRELCRGLLTDAEIDGDSNYVPGIVDLAELLAKQLKAARECWGSTYREAIDAAMKG